LPFVLVAHCRPSRPTLLPYTTLFRSRQIIKNQPAKLVIYELTEFALYSIEKELRLSASCEIIPILGSVLDESKLERVIEQYGVQDRKSTRLNSSHVKTSYAVFCLKKK